MIKHYLIVAVRNLLAHKTQTLTSLFGLSIAFACVSLATFWDHYERTYDTFQDNADRIYRVCETPLSSNRSFYEQTPESLHRYLKENYPEVEASCIIAPVSSGVSKEYYHTIWQGFMASVNGTTYPTEVTPTFVTPEALDIFDFEWVTGDRNVAGYGKNKVAISEQLAQALCGGNSPLGQTMELRSIDDDFIRECEIVGVYKTRPSHSNLKFDIIELWTMKQGMGYTYVLLKPGVNHEQFIQKMKTDTIRNSFLPQVFGSITPLTAMRYTYPLNDKVNVKLKDIDLFTTSAILLALCALLNYLILFVSRLRVRGRDMALRTIFGSSGWQMSGLLLTEYLLLLFGALLIGMLFVEILMNRFMELAMIQIDHSAVILSCGYLMLFVVILAMVLSAVPILYFKRKTLRVQIDATPARPGKNYFRSIGVCVQFIVGILFVFCTTVMMKQIYMLTRVDNIERNQVAYVSANKENHDLVRSVLQQQSFIKDFISAIPMFPPKKNAFLMVSNWDGKAAEDKGFSCNYYLINNEIARFYGLKVKEGASSFELGENEVFINEALAKRINLEKPIGKTFMSYQIKGVLYDYQVQNPTTTAEPLVFRSNDGGGFNYVVFKYEGDWETCKKTIKNELQKKGVQSMSFADGEEYYQYFLKSEYNLLKLLEIITVVSILIALFGIYALIMQSCDQYQKEIAIRKVYGAQVSDILLMFFKQYMVQLIVSAAIAFPIGYVLMKNWLEQYARQTSISFWIYLCIFLGVSILVTLCISWRIWCAANEDPARVIKKE